MKRTSSTKPYLSACLTIRNSNPTLLENAFKSIRARAAQAEIVVVDTCSSNKATLEVAQRYADVFEVYKGPRGDWDQEMAAVDDMASARQRSFELASGRWRCWVDDDDTIVGGEEATELLRKNGLWKPPLRRNQTLHEPEKELAPAKNGEGPGAVGLEDMLAWIEKNLPEATCIWSPYLYEKDEHGQAKQLLWRERIVRWDDPPRFHWAEEAHEILVPNHPYLPPRYELPHLLWVHHKDFTPEAMRYSLERHSKIMLNLWDRNQPGDRTFRRARYLSGFASCLPLGANHAGERELEFLNAAFEIAWTPIDRYRAHIALGNFKNARGLYWDAKDHYSAAQAIRPELPDAYYAAGHAAKDREDWFSAVENFRKGTKCELHPESEIVARKHLVHYPSLLAYSLQKAADCVRPSNNPGVIVSFLQEARDVSKQVMERPETGADDIEARALHYAPANAFNSERAMLEIRDIWHHLRNNDETAKAAKLLELIPWDQHNHPITMEMENWAKKIKRHLTSPQAYEEFYASAAATGLRLTTKDTAFGIVHPRVNWTIDWISKHAPEGRVLDVGCCDGQVGLPLLRMCPKADYTGVDLNQTALENFKKLLGELDMTDRKVTLENSRLPRSRDFFDVVILGEIIEHVPDPVSWLEHIRVALLAPGGTILLSTPWGAYDLGHPPEKNDDGAPRDERGHVRAYSAWGLCQDLRKAGGQVMEISRIETAPGIHWGDGACAALRHQRNRERPIAVAVAGALWQWNGSTNDRGGIGASEEMIQRTGEKLAAEGRLYDVYGPTPQEEVWTGVGYWPQPAIRHIRPETKIIVSRAPGYWKQLDDWTGREHAKVLWLQDVMLGQGDMTPENADHYESIVCVSKWHADLTAQSVGERNAGKLKTIYNWIDRGHFQDAAKLGWKDIKKPYHMIWASSPDRGLLKLLALWPRIRELYPEATLSIFYGWRGAANLGGGLNSSWNQRYLTMRREYERARWQPGVTEVGMVNHFQLAMEYAKASVWPYSTNFGETCCAAALKARAAGAVPVTSNLAALAETALCDQAVLINGCNWSPETYPDDYDDLFLEGIKRAVETSTTERQKMSAEVLEKFSWEAVEPLWKAVLT